MLKAAYPDQAGVIDVFREQIVEAMPEFELDPGAAKAYVHAMVKRAPKESFELPDLG